MNKPFNNEIKTWFYLLAYVGILDDAIFIV